MMIWAKKKITTFSGKGFWAVLSWKQRWNFPAYAWPGLELPFLWNHGNGKWRSHASPSQGTGLGAFDRASESGPKRSASNFSVDRRKRKGLRISCCVFLGQTPCPRLKERRKHTTRGHGRAGQLPGFSGSPAVSRGGFGKVQATEVGQSWAGYWPCAASRCASKCVDRHSDRWIPGKLAESFVWRVPSHRVEAGRSSARAVRTPDVAASQLRGVTPPIAAAGTHTPRAGRRTAECLAANGIGERDWERSSERCAVRFQVQSRRGHGAGCEDDAAADVVTVERVIEVWWHTAWPVCGGDGHCTDSDAGPPSVLPLRQELGAVGSDSLHWAARSVLEGGLSAVQCW